MTITVRVLYDCQKVRLLHGVYKIWQVRPKVNQKLRGHYQYYGITDNFRMLVQYCYEMRKALFKWLNRRSQRRSYTWEEFNELLKYCPLEQPKIYHSVYKTATQT